MRPRQHGGILLKLLVLLFLLFLCGAIYLLRHPLLRAAGRFWVLNEQPEKADAILLLSDDNFRAERAARAADLYRAGWAPRVVASGRRLRPYTGLAELMKRDLSERGMPVEAIVLLAHNAESTLGESLELRDLVVARGWHRVLVVTSNYHTRRARYIFHRIFPAGVLVRFIAARDADYDPDHWWETRTGLKLGFREGVALLVAMWELRHHSPAPEAAPAGASAPT
jgi:uncharacterized SAM-binding protein YcdF (DUF218 family)